MPYFINKIITILLLLLLYNKCDANQRVSGINKCHDLCFGFKPCIKQCEHDFKTSRAQNKRKQNFKRRQSVVSFSGDTFSSPSQCGLKSKSKSYGNINMRVVGGDDSLPHEFPWIVSFQIKVEKFWGGYQWKHFCGGSIINERYVLTAAHCVDKYHEYINRIRIKAGINYLTDSGQTLHPEKFIVHEQWNLRYKRNDVALVRVKERIQYQTNERNLYVVNSVCLNQDSEAPTGYANLAGWGMLDAKSQEFPDWLQKIRVPIWDRNKCGKNFADYIAANENWLVKILGLNELGRVEETHICAGGKGGEDVCMGDSGGPLTQPRNGRSYQIGIVSFGIPCALKDLPGVYTDVYKYINWIKSHAT